MSRIADFFRSKVGRIVAAVVLAAAAAAATFSATDIDDQAIAAVKAYVESVQSASEAGE